MPIPDLSFEALNKMNMHITFEIDLLLCQKQFRS